MDNLTFETIKRITADVGAIPNDSFGIRGLTSEGLLLQKRLSVRYDDKEVLEHDIYSGKLQLEKSELRALLVNLTVDDEYEFLFVFRFDLMPIHVIRVIYGRPEDSFIRIYNDEKDTWIVPGVAMNAGLLVSFEKFVSWGLLWDECKNTSDLYNVAVKLV